MNRALRLFLLFLCLFCMTSCKSKKTEKTKESVKVDLYDKYDEKKNYSLNLYCDNNSMISHLNAAVERFNKTHPNVKVSVNYLKNTSFVESVINSNSSKEIIDIYVMSTENLEKAYMGGVVTEVTGEFFTKENFSSNALEACTYKNKLYAYPYAFDTCVMVCNKNISDKVPKTYSEMEDISSNIEIGEGVVLDQIFFWDLNDIYADYSFIGSDVSVCGKSGADRKSISFKNEKSKAGLETMKEVVRFFNIKRDTVKDKTSAEVFLDGKILYSLVRSSQLDEIESKKDENFKYSVELIPSVETGGSASSLADTYCVCVNPFSKSVGASCELAKFLSYEDASNIATETEYYSARLVEGAESNIANIYKSYENSTLKIRLMDVADFYLRLDIFFENILDGDDIDTKLDEIEAYLKRLFK